MLTQDELRLSPYNQKMREHLKQLAGNVKSDDVDVYLTEIGQDAHSPGWAFLDCKKYGCLMSLSYNGVNGVSLSICVKPNKICGTGYGCLNDGYANLTPAMLDKACEIGLMHIASARRQGDIPMYKDIQELMNRFSSTVFTKL